MLLDGITLLRAATTICATAEEMSELLETLFFEQVCKLRRCIAPKGRGHATDATNVLRGILLRNALYKYLRTIFPKLQSNKYLRTIFPKLQSSISQYGTWQWFHSEYGMTETGNMPTELPGDSDDDPDEPAQGLCPEPEDASRYASKVKLVSLCMQVAKYKHDWAFSQLGRLQGHAASLDLSCEPMRNLKAKIQQIWTDYISEFPPETVSNEMPSATLDSQSPGGHADHGGITTVEVRASNRIEN